MKLAKTLYQDRTRWAVLEGDVVCFLSGTPYDGIRLDGERAPLSACRLLVNFYPRLFQNLASFWSRPRLPLRTSSALQFLLLQGVRLRLVLL